MVLLVTLGLALFILFVPITSSSDALENSPDIIHETTLPADTTHRESGMLKQRNRAGTEVRRAATRVGIEDSENEDDNVADDEETLEVKVDIGQFDTLLQQLFPAIKDMSDTEKEQARAYLSEDLNIFYSPARRGTVVDRIRAIALTLALHENNYNAFGAIIKHSRDITFKDCPLNIESFGDILVTKASRKFLKHFVNSIREYSDAQLRTLMPLVWQTIALTDPIGLLLPKYFFRRFKDLRPEILRRYLKCGNFKVLAWAMFVEGKFKTLVDELSKPNLFDNVSDLVVEDFAMVAMLPKVFLNLSETAKKHLARFKPASHHQIVASVISSLSGHKEALPFIFASGANIGNGWLVYLKSIKYRLKRDLKYEQVLFTQMPNLGKDDFIYLVTECFETEVHSDDTFTLTLINHPNPKYLSWYMKAYPDQFDIWDVATSPARLADMKPAFRRFVRSSLASATSSRNPFSDVSRLYESKPSLATEKMYFTLRPRDTYALSEPLWFEPDLLYSLFYLVSHYNECAKMIEEGKVGSNQMVMKLADYYDDIREAGGSLDKLSQIFLSKYLHVEEFRFLLGGFMNLSMHDFKRVLASSLNSADYDTALNTLMAMNNKFQLPLPSEMKLRELAAFYPPRLWTEGDLDELLILSTDARERPTVSIDEAASSLDLCNDSGFCKTLSSLVKPSIDAGFDELAFCIISHYRIDYGLVWNHHGIKEYFPEFEKSIIEFTLSRVTYRGQSLAALITEHSQRIKCSNATTKGTSAWILCKQITPNLTSLKPFELLDLVEAFHVAKAAEGSEL